MGSPHDELHSQKTGTNHGRYSAMPWPLGAVASETRDQSDGDAVFLGFFRSDE